MLNILVIVLLVLLLSGGYGLHAGYYGVPAFGGGVGLIVLVLVLVLLFGR